MCILYTKVRRKSSRKAGNTRVKVQYEKIYNVENVVIGNIEVTELHDAKPEVTFCKPWNISCEVVEEAPCVFRVIAFVDTMNENPEDLVSLVNSKLNARLVAYVSDELEVYASNLAKIKEEVYGYKE